LYISEISVRTPVTFNGDLRTDESSNTVFCKKGFQCLTSYKLTDVTNLTLKWYIYRRVKLESFRIQTGNRVS